MKRNIVTLLALCLALFALGGCNEKKSGPSVAVVDAEKVFQDSKLAQEGMAHVEELGAKFNARLAEMQAAVAAEPGNEELAKKFQVELMSLQGDFEARQMNAANKLNKLFDEAVEEYRAKNNIEIIVPAQLAIAKGEGADVTAEVIKLLDSKSVDYGPAELGLGTPKRPEAEPTDAPAAAPAPAGSPAGAATK